MLREVEPGEIVVVEDGKMRPSGTTANRGMSHMCIFEYTHFARPDVICGESVHEARKPDGCS